MTVAETLLWVLPLVPTVTALLMLTTRDRRILSAIDVGGSAILLALTLVLAREVAKGGPRASASCASTTSGSSFSSSSSSSPWPSPSTRWGGSSRRWRSAT